MAEAGSRPRSRRGHRSVSPRVVAAAGPALSAGRPSSMPRVRTARAVRSGPLPPVLHEGRPIAITVPSQGSADASGLPRDPLESAVAPFQAVFTRGSVLRHVLVMTGTGTVGILAVFLVDLLSLLYVSRLQQTDLTAAVGYATQVLFYPVSINIGLTIALTALVARALGAGDRERARRLAASGLAHATLLSLIVTVAALAFTRPILAGLGAGGAVASTAAAFLRITLPANVPFALGMGLSGVLRAAGDARRAMYVTLAGGIVTGIIDPILIFGLHMGVYGAAASTVVARFVFLGMGAWGAIRVHDLVGRPRLATVASDFRPLMGIALPAVATNLATPVANSYVFHVLSRFGDPAIAAIAARNTG